MRFIEMTGRTLAQVIDGGEAIDLAGAKVADDSIVRVNEHGDIEVRRPSEWDVIGGLLGDFENRVRRQTGMDWV